MLLPVLAQSESMQKAMHPVQADIVEGGVYAAQIIVVCHTEVQVVLACRFARKVLSTDVLPL